MIRILIFALALTACSKSDNKNGGGGAPGKPVPANRVKWEQVPRDYNPEVVDLDFRTDGAEKIEVNVFSFKDDVEVVYADMPTGTGKLRAFRVFKDSASFGDLRAQPAPKTVKLDNYGNYNCSINITNGVIQKLKGGCYVRLQIFLPAGAQIEVYNVGELLTARFVPMSNEEFLQRIDRVSWSDQKFGVISQYLSTYANLRRTPVLSTEELGKVLKQFFRGEEKLKALGQLHGYVSDRDKLAALLDKEFLFREREEARRITGL